MISELSLGRKVVSGLQCATIPSLELAGKLSKQSRKKMATALNEMVEMIKVLNAMDADKREEVISELVDEMQKIRQLVEQTGSVN